MRGFLRDLSTTIGTQGLCLGLGFVANVLVARTLGSAGMGEYTLVMTTLGLMVLMGSLGLEVSNVYLAGHSTFPPGVLMSNSIGVALVSGGLLAWLGWLLRPWALETVLQGVPSLPFVLGLCALPALLAKGFLQGLLRGRGRIPAWNLSLVVNTSLLLGFLWLSVRVWCLGVTGAMGAQLLTALLVATVLAAVSAKGLGGSWGFHGGALRAALRYGIQIHLSNVMNFFTYRLNVYLLNLALSTREVGLYAVALTLLQLVLTLPNGVQYVLLPKISRTDPSAVQRWMPVLLRVSTLLMGGLFVVLWAAAPWLIRLCYGPGYAESARPLQWLLPGGFALSLSAVMDAYNCGRGRPDIPIYASGLALVVTVGCGVSLIPRYGLLGASATASLAYGTLGVVEFLGYRRLSGRGVRESFLITRDDVRLVREAFRGTLGGPAAATGEATLQRPLNLDF
ncbi:MAG: oligosaccharide flippase family protein [Candidatus Omnitrophica bacterium]|nr:oligosaccharide flippase family protein [Candidatus Omnitrophota bacterium]